jgi:hypothetical protein
MILNITVIAQILNFGIAYFILKYLLLKPALLVIEQEIGDYESLRTYIINEEKELENEQVLKKQQWYYFSQSLRYGMPAIQVPTENIKTSTLQAFTLNAEEKKHLIEEISKKIIQRVMYD